jgi:hypothetical protein
VHSGSRRVRGRCRRPARAPPPPLPRTRRSGTRAARRSHSAPRPRRPGSDRRVRPGVKLKDQLAVLDQPLVLRPALAAVAAERLLVEAAACRHVPNRDQRLRSHRMIPLPRPPVHGLKSRLLAA